MTESTGGAEQPHFSIEKFYVKDLSLEIPHAPGIFLEREHPNIELQLRTHSEQIESGVYEVTVTITVTAKLVEKNKVMFLVEAAQSGIFRLVSLPQGELETMLNIVCPNILYPYLREVISDVSVRAGFAPVLINPINFEALYQQQQQAPGGAPSTTH